jgi:hypothetical protein
MINQFGIKLNVLLFYCLIVIPILQTEHFSGTLTVITLTLITLTVITLTVITLTVISLTVITLTVIT